MAKGFIAIDPKKQIRQLTEEGIFNLKRLHNAQGVQGWQYGRAEDEAILLSRIVTPADAQQVLAENAELKARLALLEAKEKEAKASKKSANTETTI